MCRLPQCSSPLEGSPCRPLAPSPHAHPFLLLQRQVEALTSAMKRELESVTAESALAASRASELEGTAAALRAQTEALEGALTEMRAWAAEADAGRVRGEQGAAEARAHAERAWAEANDALAAAARAEEEARAALAECARCGARAREAEEAAARAREAEAAAAARAAVAEAEVSAMRRELERLRRERAASAMEVLTLRTSVAAGFAAGTIQHLPAVGGEAQGAGWGEQGGVDVDGEGEGGGAGGSDAEEGGREAADVDAPLRPSSSSSSSASKALARASSVAALMAPLAATARGASDAPAAAPANTASRRFVIEVAPEAGSQVGRGGSGVSLRAVPGASIVVALDGGEERVFGASRVLQSAAPGATEGRGAEVAAIASAVAGGASGLILLATAPSLAERSLQAMAVDASGALFSALEAACAQRGGGASVDFTLLRVQCDGGGSSSSSGGGGGGGQWWRMCCPRGRARRAALQARQASSRACFARSSPCHTLVAAPAPAPAAPAPALPAPAPHPAPRPAPSSPTAPLFPCPLPMMLR